MYLPPYFTESPYNSYLKPLIFCAYSKESVKVASIVMQFVVVSSSSFVLSHRATHDIPCDVLTALSCHAPLGTLPAVHHRVPHAPLLRPGLDPLVVSVQDGDPRPVDVRCLPEPSQRLTSLPVGTNGFVGAHGQTRLFLAEDEGLDVQRPLRPLGPIVEDQMILPRCVVVLVPAFLRVVSHLGQRGSPLRILWPRKY